MADSSIIRRDPSRLADPRSMSFGEHLDELRKRVIVALVGILPIFIAAVAGGKWLLAVLLDPVQQELRRAGLPATLLVTGPLESFSAWFRVAFVVTLLVGLPWVIYQVWLFVAPGLYAHERRFAHLILPMSVLLSALGIAFLYFVMLPAMLAFLIDFGATIYKPEIETAPVPAGTVLAPLVPILEYDPVDPPPGSVWINRTLKEWRVAMPTPEGKIEILGTPLVQSTGIAQQFRVSEYIGLVFIMGLSFAVGFQTPVVVLLLGWVGLVDRKFLARNRKYALFICAIAAAILTPSPDPFSMIILAAPLYLLYELGMILLRVLPAGRVARGFSWAGKRYGVSQEPPTAGDE